MGSKSGEIEIYYIDDLTPKGEPKIKAHDCSPFNFFSQKLLSIKGKMEKYKTKSNPSHHKNNKSSKQIIIISTHKFLRKVLAFCLVNIKT